jgi:hypothetical protein
MAKKKQSPYTDLKSPSPDFLNSISTGLVKVIAASDLWERLTVKARSDSTKLLPEKFIGLRRLVMYIASIGHNYEDAINHRLEKSGLDCVHGKFEADGTYTRAHPKSTNGILLVHEKDIDLPENNPEKRNYVRTYIMGHEPKVSYEEYYVNVKNEILVPTAQEIADFFPIVQDSKKQEEFWLEGNAQVKVRNFKSHNILYLQRGDKVYNNLFEKVMKLFDLEYI